MYLLFIGLHLLLFLGRFVCSVGLAIGKLQMTRQLAFVEDKDGLEGQCQFT